MNIEKFFSKISKPRDEPCPSNNEVGVEDENPPKIPRIELSEDQIIGDPGLRNPIDSYSLAIQDEMRRRYVLKGPCQPHNYNFPKRQLSGGERKFQKHWFKDFDWLEYSVTKDAVYCFICYLFRSVHKHGEISFTSFGFTNWKKALEKFREHEGRSIHHYAKDKYLGYKDQSRNIDHVIIRQEKELDIAYRVRLTATLDVIRFLLQQGLAFRGHDESIGSMQRGNFLELIKWYSDRDEKIKNVTSSNAPRNNQVTSPRIQRHMVNACATEVRKFIVDEIGSKYFSLLLDESRDSSVKEQMSIVLRFVNDGGEVVERFFGIVHVTDTSAKSLKLAVDDFFAKSGLSLSKVRGQGYDGAANMSGSIGGLKELILHENPQAHYVHCFAHRLQLVVVNATKHHGKVGNFFEYLVMIVNVVGALCKRCDILRQKRHENLVKKIESGEIATGSGKNQETSLARHGETRWGSHFKSIDRVLLMWDPIFEVLEGIYNDAIDLTSKSTASGLIDKMNGFDFVFMAHLLSDVLGKTNAVSTQLQQKNQNIGNAMLFIGTVKSDLNNYRNVYGWKHLLKVVTDFCSNHDVDVLNMEDAMPGRFRKRTTVDGQPKTYYNYFHEDIFCEVLDLVISEIDARFPNSCSELLMGISCLSPRDSFSNFNHEKLLRMATFYPDDFDSSDRRELMHQLLQYIDFVKSDPNFSNLQDICDLAKKLVKTEWSSSYKLVFRLIELALVLPVATASVERSFSAMKLVKNDLRNKIGDELISDCLVCYVEKDIFISIENEVILQRFQKMASRRGQLSFVNI